MSVTMQQVRAALDPEEPNYATALGLGPDAAPHLAALIDGEDPGLAAKAAYLAGCLGLSDLVDKAARHNDVTVRVAAASVAQRLPTARGSNVIEALLDDDDRSVRKLALQAISPRSLPALAEKLAKRVAEERDPKLREIAQRAVQRMR